MGSPEANERFAEEAGDFATAHSISLSDALLLLSLLKHLLPEALYEAEKRGLSEKLAAGKSVHELELEFRAFARERVLQSGIEIMPGMTLIYDEEKFEPQAALKLGELPYGDWRLALDLRLTNVIERTEQKVENLIVLRKR